MSKNKKGLGTPEEIAKRDINSYTYEMVLPAKPRLRRDVRRSVVKLKKETQAILNKELFNHRRALNWQYDGIFPAEAYNTPTAKKEGKMRPSIVNLHQLARTGSRNTSEINRLARIERRRKWEQMNAEVMGLIA